MNKKVKNYPKQINRASETCGTITKGLKSISSTSQKKKQVVQKKYINNGNSIHIKC